MNTLDHLHISSLVKKAQNGDPNAFEELYVITYRRQYLYAYQYMRDSYLAQDAVHEVFLLAYKNLHILKDPTVFVAWLNQINFRVCYKLCKKNSICKNELCDDSIINEQIDASVNGNPLDYIIQTNEREEIINAVKSLPNREQTALFYKYYHDMKLEDIAVNMDCSRSTVKRLLANGRRQLFDKLKDIVQ